jgi:hypothetical protein
MLDAETAGMWKAASERATLDQVGRQSPRNEDEASEVGDASAQALTARNDAAVSR